jgi:tetratricopeptide (TPR) repeat protein
MERVEQGNAVVNPRRNGRLVVTALLLAATCQLGCGPGQREERQVSASRALEASNQSSGEPTVVSDSPGTPDPVAPDPVALRSDAQAALQAGDLETAGRAIRAAIVLAPDDPQTKYTLALVLGAEHRFPEAIRMLDKLAATSPEAELPALGQTAEWMVLHGMWEQAEVRFRKVLGAVPDAIMAHRQLSRLLLRQGRRVEAAVHLRELCRLGNVEEVELRSLLSIACPLPGDADREELEPISILARARAKASRQDWRGAADQLQSSHTRRAEEHALLGRCFAMLQDEQMLAQWAAESESLSEKGSDPLRRGQETNEIDSPPKGQTPFRIGSPPAGDTADAWFARARFESQQGRHQAAVEMLCQAIVQDPTDSEAYSSLASALREIGNQEQSQCAQQRAQWITTTRTLADEVSASGQRDAKQLLALAESLDQLQRPFEADAWRAVCLAYGQQGLSTQQVESLTQQIQDRRERLLQSDQGWPSAEFLLCGLDSNEPK